MSNGFIASSDGIEICYLFSTFFTSVYCSDDKIVYFQSDYLQSINNTNSDVMSSLAIDDRQLIEKLCTLNSHKIAGSEDIPHIS